LREDETWDRATLVILVAVVRTFTTQPDEYADPLQVLRPPALADSGVPTPGRFVEAGYGDWKLSRSGWRT